MGNMSIADIKARLAAAANKTKKEKDIWKPSDEHDIRALPHSFSKGEDPFVELHFHYEIGNEPPILCPKHNFGDDCDICDFCEQLRAWRDADGEEKKEADRKADWEMFKKISAKNCWAFPMVERDKVNEGKYSGWCRLNMTNYNVLLGICVDEENNKEVAESGNQGGTGVLFDPDCAYDLHVSFKKKGEKGNTKTFNLVEFKEKKKPSALHKDKKVVEKILASIKPIYEVYPKRTSEEVSKIFKKFVGSAAEEAKPEGGTEKYPTNSKESAKDVGKRSIDEAFDEMSEEN